MDLLTTTLAEAIKSRNISPVELTQDTLDRIDLLEPRLNAFITLCGDRAMEGPASPSRRPSAGAIAAQCTASPTA